MALGWGKNAQGPTRADSSLPAGKTSPGAEPPVPSRSIPAVRLAGQKQSRILTLALPPVLTGITEARLTVPEGGKASGQLSGLGLRGQRPRPGTPGAIMARNEHLESRYEKGPRERRRGALPAVGPLMVVLGLASRP